MKSAALTIVHYSANRLDHVRPRFAQAVRDQIIRCAEGRFPIITVSHEPIPGFGDQNIVVGPVERGHLRIYRNVLIGAQAATTDYVGLAEDDIFYAPSHFTTHRPPSHKFSYDFNKWGVNTWVTPPVFGYRSRAVINQLIAPRQLLVDALEERFAKFAGVPDSQVPLKFWGDLGRYEKHLGVTVREWEPFAAPDPSVVFSHEEAFGYLSQGTRKSVGEGHLTQLPYWGSAEKMMAFWRQCEEKAA